MGAVFVAVGVAFCCFWAGRDVIWLIVLCKFAIQCLCVCFVIYLLFT